MNHSIGSNTFGNTNSQQQSTNARSSVRLQENLSELPLRRPDGSFFHYANNGKFFEEQSPYYSEARSNNSPLQINDSESSIQPFDPSQMDQSEWLEALFEFQIPSNLQPFQIISQTSQHHPSHLQSTTTDLPPNNSLSNLHALLNHSEPATILPTNVISEMR